ncbi:MAG TPA: hypothetical protein VGD62_10475 [Acidobacteriaceae bacterium]
MGLLHAGTTLVAAFLASLVECVEALTVVLAVGSVRGWRPALAGAAAALGVLAAIVLVFGASLARIPLHLLQAGVGVLLLLFGLRWLRKAVLRAAGLIPLHDEAAAYARSEAAMRTGAPGSPAGRDRVAFAACFHITMLEGTEVVFLVMALGAGLHAELVRASLGALAALVVVAALGVALHRPLVRVPENALKFVVGVLLSAFGTFWAGEGLGLAWPGSDWSLPGLVGVYLLLAVALVPACRAQAAAAPVRV